MYKQLATEIMNYLQNFYKEQKEEYKFIFKGEEAMLLYLNERSNDNIISPSEISEDLNITSARVATSLNSLQSKELITREIDKVDRRKIVINLTDKGIKLANELKETHLNDLASILEKLGLEEANNLIQVSQKFMNILREEKKNVKINQCK